MSPRPPDQTMNSRGCEEVNSTPSHKIQISTNITTECCTDKRISKAEKASNLQRGFTPFDKNVWLNSFQLFWIVLQHPMGGVLLARGVGKEWCIRYPWWSSILLSIRVVSCPWRFSFSQRAAYMKYSYCIERVVSSYRDVLCCCIGLEICGYLHHLLLFIILLFPRCTIVRKHLGRRCYGRSHAYFSNTVFRLSPVSRWGSTVSPVQQLAKKCPMEPYHGRGAAASGAHMRMLRVFRASV